MAEFKKNTKSLQTRLSLPDGVSLPLALIANICFVLTFLSISYPLFVSPLSPRSIILVDRGFCADLWTQTSRNHVNTMFVSFNFKDMSNIDLINRAWLKARHMSCCIMTENSSARIYAMAGAINGKIICMYGLPWWALKLGLPVFDNWAEITGQLNILVKNCAATVCL